MGPDSENIPSERSGGEARRANLKQNARYLKLSVAETFVCCTLKTASLEKFSKPLELRVSVVFFIPGYCFMYIACSVSDIFDIYIPGYCFMYIACSVSDIFDIYSIEKLHILHIYCTDAYKCFQDCFCPEDVQNSSLPTLSKDILREMLPDIEVNETSLHEGDGCMRDLACKPDAQAGRVGG